MRALVGVVALLAAVETLHMRDVDLVVASAATVLRALARALAAALLVHARKPAVAAGLLVTPETRLLDRALEALVLVAVS